jgi:hypothetical protein
VPPLLTTGTSGYFEINYSLRHLQVAAVWSIIGGAATYLFLFDPATGVAYPPCPFRMLTGLQCPGCGAARGLHQLLHGHPIVAFELNPLVIMAVPLLLLLLLAFTRSAYSRGKISERFRQSKYGWIFLAFVVAFWIFRNTSLYPFAS